MAKRIGFFGGTFDPFHIGHIHLALSLLEKHHLDKVLFSPASLSPHKSAEPPIASSEDRLEMVKRGIAPISCFELYSKEVERGGISYTIDAIRELNAQGEKAEYFLLFGEDLIPSMHLWKDVEELFMLVKPLIGCRDEKVSIASSELSQSLLKALERGRTSIPLLSISSTSLRSRLKLDLYCRHLIPDEVLKYIRDKKLYKVDQD